MAFTSDGRAYGMPVRDLPDTGLSARGKRLHQLLELPKNAEIAGVHLVGEFSESRAVLFATAGGTVKRTSLDQFTRPRAGGVEAISLRSGDRLAFVAITDGESEVVLAGSGGRAIRFGEGDIPLMGRATQGVRGMKLDAKERLVGLAAGKPDAALVAVTARGQGKRFLMDDLPLQKRDGKGTVLVPGGKEFGELVALMPLGVTDLAAVTAGGMMRIRRADLPVLPREARPEPVLELAKNERIVAVTAYAERDATAPVTTADELLEEPSTDGGDSSAEGGDEGDGGSPAGGDDGDDGNGGGDDGNGGGGGGVARSSAADVTADSDDAAPPAAEAAAADNDPGLFADTAQPDGADDDDAIIEEPIVAPKRSRKPAREAVAEAPAPPPPPTPEPPSAPTPKRGRKPAASAAPQPEPAPAAEPAPRRQRKAPAPEQAAEPTPAPKRARASKAAAPPPPEPEPEPPAETARRGKKKAADELDLFG
jgi:hypothetical protein